MNKRGWWLTEPPPPFFFFLSLPHVPAGPNEAYIFAHTMSAETFLSTLGDGIARASKADDAWHVTPHLQGLHIRCLAGDPCQPLRAFAGGVGGVHMTADAGSTWMPRGLEGETVTALAASAARDGTLWAGTKPAHVWRSTDAGATWQRLEAFASAPGRWWWVTPSEAGPAYVQALAPSPSDVDTLHVGIEVGGVVSTFDGGATWSRARGALWDCHGLAADPHDARSFHQAGAGLCASAATSSDDGRTWRKVASPLRRAYGWAVAADPAEPGAFFWSTTSGPAAAHGHHDARATIHRLARDGSVESLTPEPFTAMPYALHALADGRLFACCADGSVHAWAAGSWQRLPFTLGAVERAAIMLTEA